MQGCQRGQSRDGASCETPCRQRDEGSNEGEEDAPAKLCRPAKKPIRPPYCSSTATARHEAIAVNDEKIWKTGR